VQTVFLLLGCVSGRRVGSDIVSEWVSVATVPVCETHSALRLVDIAAVAVASVWGSEDIADKEGQSWSGERDTSWDGSVTGGGSRGSGVSERVSGGTNRSVGRSEARPLTSVQRLPTGLTTLLSTCMPCALPQGSIATATVCGLVSCREWSCERSVQRSSVVSKL
jgi:hypothetical protein